MAENSDIAMMNDLLTLRERQKALREGGMSLQTSFITDGLIDNIERCMTSAMKLNFVQAVTLCCRDKEQRKEIVALFNHQP